MRQFAMGALVLLFAAACGGGDDQAVAPPGAVPAGASEVRADLDLWEQDAVGLARVFSSQACDDDVLVIATTLETVYAELPCDRALPADVEARFLDTEVSIRLRPGEGKLFVFSAEGGSAEYTVGRMWLDDGGR
jgi:hypothetical protein